MTGEKQAPDAANPPEGGAQSDAMADPAASAKPKPKPRRRRLKRVLMVTLAVLLVGRLSLSLILPSLVEQLAESYGLHCTWRSLELSFSGGEFELWHMELVSADDASNALTTPPPDGEHPEHAREILFLEYVRADLSMLDLLRGDLVLRRAEVDGVDVLLELDNAGQPKFLQRFLSDAVVAEDVSSSGSAASGRAPRSNDGAKKPVAASDAPRTTPSLEPFFQLDALRLQHVNVHVLEVGTETPVDLGVDVDLRLSDLAAAGRTTRFDLTVRALPVLDLLQVHGSGTSDERRLDARLSVKGRGLRPGRVAELLKAFGVAPAANRLDFGLTAEVHARPLADSETALSISALISDLALSADGMEAAAVDRVSVEVASLDGGEIDIEQVHVQGVRAHAEQMPGGALRVAGVDLLPGAGGSPTKEKTPEMDDDSPDGGAAIRWTRLGSFLVTDVEAAFRDLAVPGDPELRLRLPRLELTALDPGGASADLAGELSIDGLVEKVQLSGQLAPFASPQTYQVSVQASGLSPEALRPYLHPEGIEPDGTPSSLRLSLAAVLDVRDEGLEAELHLSDIEMLGADRWLALERLDVNALELPSAGDVLRVGSVDIAGGRLLARRSAEDVLQLLGLRIHPPGAGPFAAEAELLAGADALVEAAAEVVEEVLTEAEAAVAVAADAGAAAAAGVAAGSEAASLRLELGPVVLTDFALEFEDETLGPLGIEDIGLQAGPLQLGGAAASDSPLEITCAIPGVVGRFGIHGHVVTSQDQVDLGIDLLAEHITAERLAPLLAEAGVSPQLEDGQFALRLDAGMGLGEVSRLDVRVSDILYVDGDQEFLSVEELSVDGLLAGEEELQITRVAVTGPSFSARRGADGALQVAGFRVELPDAAEQGAESAPVAAATATPVASTPDAEGGSEPASPSVMRLAALELSGASFHWQDEAVDPPVDLVTRVDAGLDNLVLGVDDSPMTYRVSLAAPGLIDSLSVTGTALVGALDQRLGAVLDVRGLCADALAGYLPPDLELSLQDGRFAARLELEHARLSGADGPEISGGDSLGLVVSEMSFRDGVDGDPFLAMERFAVRAPRLDPEGGLVHVEAIELVGFEVVGALRADGGLSLFGVELPAPGGEGVTATATDTDTATDTATAPAPTPATRDSRAPDPDSRRAPPPPELRLDRLDLQVARLVLTRPDAPELGITDLRLQSVEPIVLMGEDAEGNPPTRLALAATIAPEAGEVAVALDLHPFAAEPRLAAEVDMSGLRGSGLMELATAAVPQLPELVDMSELVEGTFHAAFEVVANVPRRSPTDLRFEDGFGAEIVLSKVALRQTPDGAPQLGLNELAVDIGRFDPGTGALRIRSVDVETPIAYVTKRSDGLLLAGVRLLLPAPPEEEVVTDAATAAAEAKAADEAAGPSGVSAADAPQQVPQAASAPVQGPGTAIASSTPPADVPEIRIDELLVTGLDLLVVDETTDPVFILPLQELEVDARGLTTRALSEALPIRTSVLLGIGAPEDPTATVGEVAMFTDLQLFPTLSGGVKLDVSSLEVLPFRGPAAAAGVTLAGGVVDVTSSAYFPGDGSTEVDMSLQLTDLDVSEGDDGPLQNLLALPAPLDAVLFVLRDEQGTIEIPLAFDVDEGGISLVAISTAGVSALSSIIVSAVASSPLRMASALGDLTGLFGEEEPLDMEPVLVEFEPGSPGMQHDGVPMDEVLAELRERLLDDERLVLTLRHEFGEQDVELVRERANPSEEVCLALLAELRARKSILLEERAEAQETAYSALITRGSAFAAEEGRRLRETDRKLGETERALDEILEILRPGADRKRKTRTKGASLELAALRLMEVRELLLADGAEELAPRVRVSRARFRAPTLPAGGRVRAELTAKRPR